MMLNCRDHRNENEYLYMINKKVIYTGIKYFVYVSTFNLLKNIRLRKKLLWRGTG